jgi:hypothetical protein
MLDSAVLSIFRQKCRAASREAECVHLFWLERTTAMGRTRRSLYLVAKGGKWPLGEVQSCRESGRSVEGALLR